MLLRAALLSIAMLLSACAPPKLSEENVAKIREGMTEKEVTAILGPPTETKSGAILGITGASSVWKEGDATLSLQFVNERVVLKTYAKGR